MSKISQPTVADVMVTQLQKISDSLEELHRKGLPMSLILAYVQKKTHLPQREIKAVMEALGDLNKELKQTERKT